MESLISADSRNDRIEYIDIAKAIGIFLVLVGHTVESDTLLKIVLYAFHMPLFFFLSGMVIKRKKCKSDYRNWILAKAEYLLIPYILWGSIYSAFSFKNMVYIMYGTRETLIKAGSLTSLWFLPVLFIASILGEIIVHYCDEKSHADWYVAALSVLLFVTGGKMPHIESYGYPWGIDIVLVAVAFMLFGFLLRRWLDVLVNQSIVIQGGYLAFH